MKEGEDRERKTKRVRKALNTELYDVGEKTGN